MNCLTSCLFFLLASNFLALFSSCTWKCDSFCSAIYNSFVSKLISHLSPAARKKLRKVELMYAAFGISCGASSLGKAQQPPRCSSTRNEICFRNHIFSELASQPPSQSKKGKPLTTNEKRGKGSKR